MTAPNAPVAASLAAPTPVRPWLSPLIMTVAIACVLGRLATYDFTWWDDHVTLHQNERLNPVTFESLRYYWTTPELGLYVPVTQTVWTVLAGLADRGLPNELGIKLNPTIFHVVNLLVHLVSSLLVLALLRRFVHREWPALAGALLFALHPLQVETIGWLSGLKDLLCWCFALAACLLYVRRAQACAADERLSLWKSVELPAASLLLILALLSKPTALVLPAALGVIDVMLIGRHWRRVLVGLLPLLAISAVGALIARHAQYVHHVPAAPLWQRPFIVGDSTAFYLRKLVWPQTLTIDYGRQPAVAMSTAAGYLWWILPAALFIVVCLLYRRGLRLPLVAAAILMIGFAPVSGLATFQMQFYSTVTDHYLYFSLLGPALLLAWIIDRWPRPALHGAVVVILLAFSVRSFFQTRIWRDSHTLFAHAIEANPRSFASISNLASMYLSQRPPRPDLAEELSDRAFAFAPDNFAVASTQSAVKYGLGKYPEAFRAWEQCRLLLKSAPPDVRASFSGGVAISLLRIGELDRAADWAREAEEADPQHPHAAAAISEVRRALARRAASQPTTIRTPTTSASPDPQPASAR